MKSRSGRCCVSGFLWDFRVGKGPTFDFNIIFQIMNIQFGYKCNRDQTFDVY